MNRKSHDNLVPFSPRAEDEPSNLKQSKNILFEAEAGEAAEHRLGLLAALKLYPKASIWSILISFAVVMEGYDLVLLGSFCGSREHQTVRY